MVDEATGEELLTFDDALQVLGTSRPTLYRLLNQGNIKGLKVGKQWRFRKTDIQAYLERSPVAIAAAPDDHLDLEMAFFHGELGEDREQFADATAEEKTFELAGRIIRLAIDRKASDIHMEPLQVAGDTYLVLRYRIDGVLVEIRRMPMSLHPSLIARFKMMADMNVGEQKLPQDGRIPVKIDGDGRMFDLRCNISPYLHGEGLVIRILDRSNVLIGLDKLGLLEDNQAQLATMIRQPNGIVIVTGPTGSGKTTTLYSCLQAIASSQVKSISVEDPIEYSLEHVDQCQVDKRAGLTFAGALRNCLRQDPDIIFVGENRDLETIRITVEIALTGHLVLTTLHAADAASAIVRLMDIGVEPYLVVGTVIGVVAQRLARRLCESCKEPIQPSAIPSYEAIRRLGALGGYELPHDATLYRGRGCEACRGRGYRGRIGLFEILESNELLTEAIQRRPSADELGRIAVESGMRTLWADGLRKAALGLTTVDEIRRVVFTAGF
jgi:excisionase family DNA binding protein